MSNVEPSASHVFITYASADRTRVQPVVDALDALGIEVWIDRDGISSGASYGPAIAGAIRSSAAVIVLCSPVSLASRNVRQEIAVAWKHERPLLPLMLEPGVELPEDVEYWLEGAQWIEVFDRPADEWIPQLIPGLERLGLELNRRERAAIGAQPGSFQVPVAIAPLIGRRAEIEAVGRLISENRLVTLLGPGGTGKTRLALAVAEELRDSFADGILFVNLTPIREPELVIPAIAMGMGVRETAERTLVASLTDYLAGRELLLILDNCEQVVGAAPDISDLLHRCPSLKLLATSREPLRISGEREYPLPPLDLPDVAGAPDLNQLRENEAIALFGQRATAARPDFELMEENAKAVAAICHRLDGLPLAIELAAARVKVLAPEAILARMEQPLTLLVGGSRDLAAHQRTMRDTIQWSYELLDSDEQALFRCLSAFVGGWTLEAAEAVANAARDLGVDVLDALMSLVDKSLVTQQAQPGDEVRFAMLETIREFGLEQLALLGEQTALFNEHARYMLDLAEKADAGIRGRGQWKAIHWFHTEQGNLRAVLSRSLRDQELDPEPGRRLAATLIWVWFVRNQFREARDWLALALTNGQEPGDVLQAKLNVGYGIMRWRIGELEEGEASVEAGLAVLRDSGERWHAALALHEQAHLVDELGDPQQAMRLFEQSIDEFRAIDDPWGVALGNSCLARTLHATGQLDSARQLAERARVELEDLGDEWLLGLTLQRLADVTLDEGRYRESAEWYRQAIRIFTELGGDLDIADAFVRLAQISAAVNEPARAARLFGAAEVIHDTYRMMLYERLRLAYDAAVAQVRSALGAAQFEALWAEGRAMTLEEATAYALEQPGDLED